MNTIIYDFQNNQFFNENITKDLNTDGEVVDIQSKIVMRENNNSQMNINIEHNKDNTKSKIVIRAVLKDDAKLTITGNLHIEKSANNCDAYFEAKVLVLGGKARAVVLPELKIDNKNVKARHAVVIKRISDQDLYFLESRGVNLVDAERILTEGFLNI